MGIFPFHCKYTAEDRKWLLEEAGFSLATTVNFARIPIFFWLRRGREQDVVAKAIPSEDLFCGE